MPTQSQDTVRTTPRSYRSTKRPRPCDQCRGRKLKCVILHEPPCQRCQSDGIQCNLPQRSSRRSNRSVTCNGSGVSGSAARDVTLPRLQQDPFPPVLNHPYNSPSHEPALDRSTPPSNLESDGRDQPVEQSEAVLVPDPILIRPLTQISHSLEDAEGSRIIFLGASSSADPWLLRHTIFDQYGFHSFNRLQFRNAGGVPAIGKIPVQFLVTADDFPSHAVPQAATSEVGIQRTELDRLIPIVQGARMIRLYVLTTCDSSKGRSQSASPRTKNSTN